MVWSNGRETIPPSARNTVDRNPRSFARLDRADDWIAFCQLGDECLCSERHRVHPHPPARRLILLSASARSSSLNPISAGDSDDAQLSSSLVRPIQVWSSLPAQSDRREPCYPYSGFGGPHGGSLPRSVRRSNTLATKVVGRATRRTDDLDVLTPREHDVLSLMAEGRTNGAIAGTLVISERAVEKNVANIFSKLGLAPSDTDHRRVLAVLRYLES